METVIIPTEFTSLPKYLSFVSDNIIKMGGGIFSSVLL
jgi:hypothetical protein